MANITEVLMAKITEVMANLLRATVAKDCKCFRLHIDVAAGNAGGDFLSVKI
jgi:hypothetical protein